MIQHITSASTATNKAAARQLLEALTAAAAELGISPEPKLLWSAEETASHLGLSDRFVGELAARGDLPSVMIGARRLFRPEDVRAWVNAGCPHPQWSAARRSKE